MNKPSFLRREWLQLLLLALPFIAIPFVWSHLPEQIPTHWNLAGEPDDYSHKAFGLLILPVLNIFTTALLFGIPYIDPRRENFELFANTMRSFRLLFTTFMLVVFSAIVAAGLGYDFAIERVICVCLILLFLVLGNMFGKVRSNYFVGIRTPWTLDNPEVWRRTHRMAAVLWVAASIIALPAPMLFDGTALFVIMMVYVGTITFVPLIYSLVTFRKLKGKDQSQRPV